MDSRDVRENLLAGKLARPSTPPGFVPRQRLADALEAGADRPLTLVTAGPGWGKTLTVASWLDQRESDALAAEPCAVWVSLDEQDNSAEGFWSSVLAGLRHAGAIPVGHPLLDVTPSAGVTPDVQLRIVAALADLPGPVRLVIDDFQVLDQAVVLDGVAALLQHPGAVRLVLLSRVDPTLPLHRLRLRTEIAEIRAKDLALRHDEAHALLAMAGYPQSHDDVASLIDRTEGWAVGLRLAALFLSAAEPGVGVEDFAGDHSTVADYLISEVLEKRPPDEQDFLLRTSIVERVSPELADALCGGGSSASRLEALAHQNLFVTALGPRQTWFRYHPLLREMLEHRFRRERPDEYRAAHLAAARWFADRMADIEALRHAAAADDWDLVAYYYITMAAPNLLGARRQVAHDVLMAIPNRRLGDSALLQLCAAGRMVFEERFRDLSPCLATARSMIPALPPDAVAPATAMLAVLDATTGRLEGDLQRVLESSEAGLRVLADTVEPFPASGAYRAVLLNMRGSALTWLGHLTQARSTFEAALLAAEGHGLDLLRVNVLGHLAQVSAMSGRLGDAERYARSSLELADARGWLALRQAVPAALTEALLMFARSEPKAAELTARDILAADNEAPLALAARLLLADCYIDLGRLELAADETQAAKALAETFQVPEPLGRRLVIATAEAALRSGEPQMALRILDEQSLGPDGVAERNLRARSLLALGDSARARQTLVGSDGQISPAYAIDTLSSVERWLLLAVVAEVQGAASAMGDLSRALDVARHDGVMRPFVALASVRAMRLLDRHLQLHRSDAFAAEVRERMGPPSFAVADVSPLAIPLSDRELEVLELLATMRSNDEIAAELFVSVNTVKAHLKSLFRKLDVTTRRDAVRRGRALDLVP